MGKRRETRGKRKKGREGKSRERRVRHNDIAEGIVVVLIDPMEGLSSRNIDKLSILVLVVKFRELRRRNQQSERFGREKSDWQRISERGPILPSPLLFSLEFSRTDG